MRKEPWKIAWTVVLGLCVLFLCALPFLIILNVGPSHPLAGEVKKAFDLSMLARSVLLSALSATAGLLFALPLALAAASAGRRLGGLTLALACGALVIPSYTLWYAYEPAFAAVGVFGALHGPCACVFMFTLAIWPVEALVILGAIRRETAPLVEAARQHAGPWRTFRGVTLPLILPGIALGWAFAFFLSFADSSIPMRLGVATLGTRIQVRLALDYDLAAASVYFASFMLVLIVVLAALRIFLSRCTFASGPTFSGRGAIKGRWWMHLPGAAGIALSVVVPLLMLVRHLSFAGVSQIISANGPQILRSAFIAALSASAVAVCGFWVAAWRDVRRRGGRWLIEAVCVIPFALAGIFIAVGAKRVLEWEPLYWIGASWGVLIVAYFVHYIFIGLEGAFLGIGSIDRSLTDAARTLGAGALRRVLGITLPLAARPLAAAWALVFVLVLPEPDIALMTAPPGWELASVSLHNQMHYNYEMQTSALSLIMILIASVPLTLFFIAGPRYGRSRS